MQLSNPQSIFLHDLGTKYRAYVGGFGSGKTFVGCLDLLNFGGKHPRNKQGYFGPSYPSIRDIFYPTFDEAAHMVGFRAKVNEGNKEVHFYRGRSYYGTIICRSMENPESIVGFKIARALVDEIDVLNKDKATRAWNKIIARLRITIPGVVNSVGVTTTPEGFRFVYDKFADNPTPSYSMVQASTYENEDYLPPDYIDSLRETYPTALIDAYLKGKFVNLTSGSVYPTFSRLRNHSYESIQGTEPLYIGMDFNVGKMAACIFVRRGTQWHQVEELIDVRDTPTIIDTIKERWGNHHITVYPDATGQNRTSKSASKSDIGMLEAADFTVLAKKVNPKVKDRVLSVNKQFEDKNVFVNTMRCPTTTKNLEQQAYDDNGEPDKKSGFDHTNDAFGYPIVYEFPINRPIANMNVSFAQ